MPVCRHCVLGDTLLTLGMEPEDVKAAHDKCQGCDCQHRLVSAINRELIKEATSGDPAA